MKKKSKTVTKEREIECHKILEELADMILYQASSHVYGIEDPFEDYKNRINAHFYKDPARFKERFAQGFHVLMKEVEHLP